MRIGLFTETYLPQINGVSTSVGMLKDSLEKLGHIVYIITANVSNNDWIFDSEKNILYVPGVKTGIYDYKLCKTNMPKNVLKIFESWSLDIIHSQHEFGTGVMAIKLAKKYHIPLVHTLHSMYEENIYYITKGHFMRLGKYILKKLTYYFCDKKCDTLVVPTVKVYNLLKEYGFIKEINIIPSGIYIEKFNKNNLDKEKLNELKDKYELNGYSVLISVGRLSLEKNFEFLINSMNDLLKFNKKIKLLIVGEGPNRDNLVKMIKTLNLENNIILTGKVAYDDMPYYYNISDIMVSASTSETQGLSVIEAMAIGVVSVVIRDEAFCSMIDNLVDGKIFENRDEYIDSVLEILSNNNLRKDLIKNGNKKILEYSSMRFAEKIINLYKKTIKEYK